MRQLPRMLENIEARYTAGKCPVCQTSVFIRPTGLIAAHTRFDKNHKNPRACEGNLQPYTRKDGAA